MKVVIFTAVQRSWLQKAIISRVADVASDLCIVIVDRTALPWRLARSRYLWRKARRRGVRRTLSDLRDRPERSVCLDDWDSEARRELNRLMPELRQPEGIQEHVVKSVNGKDAVQTLQALEPDVIIQAGAGILKPQVFNIARLATLNMHHGYAPRIRGGASIFWGVYHGRPDWVGVTIHQIDAGLDTGPVYARKHLQFNYGTHPAYLFAQATAIGLDMLQEVIESLGSQEIEPFSTRDEPSTYRSFFTSHQYRSLAANDWNPVAPLPEEHMDEQ